jgi:flagellar motor switch protein FliG
MSQKSAENGGVFINGKKQVIELLQRMDATDKVKLLKNLRLRNPTLAKELTESCLSFESIWDLDDECLKTVVSQVKPAILGLALSLVHVKNQRRALSMISRDMAIKAFEIMQKDLTSNRSECLRAQLKILELAISLQRNRVIQFY